MRGPPLANKAVNMWHEEEALQQIFANELRESSFNLKEELVLKIDEYISRTGGQILKLVGPRRCGKSTFVATWIHLHKSKNDTPVFEFYGAVTEWSCTFSGLITIIIDTLSKHFCIAVPKGKHMDEAKLIPLLGFILKDLAKCIILIDDISNVKMESGESASDVLEWLPLQPNVHMILTGTSPSANDACQILYFPEIDINDLVGNHSEILNDFQASSTIVGKFKAEKSPEFLFGFIKALRIAATMGLDTSPLLTQYSEVENLADVFESVVVPYFGSHIVNSAGDSKMQLLFSVIGLLLHSPNGLSLKDILKLFPEMMDTNNEKSDHDDPWLITSTMKRKPRTVMETKILSILPLFGILRYKNYFWLPPNNRELAGSTPGLLKPIKSFKQIGGFKQNETRTEYTCTLIKHFQSIKNHVRKAENLPRLLMQNGHVVDLHRAISEVDTFQTMWEDQILRLDLLKYWIFLMNESELKSNPVFDPVDSYVRSINEMKLRVGIVASSVAEFLLLLSSKCKMDSLFLRPPVVNDYKLLRDFPRQPMLYLPEEILASSKRQRNSTMAYLRDMQKDVPPKFETLYLMPTLYLRWVWIQFPLMENDGIASNKAIGYLETDDSNSTTSADKLNDGIASNRTTSCLETDDLNSTTSADKLKVGILLNRRKSCPERDDLNSATLTSRRPSTAKLGFKSHFPNIVKQKSIPFKEKKVSEVRVLSYRKELDSLRLLSRKSKQQLNGLQLNIDEFTNIQNIANSKLRSGDSAISKLNHQLIRVEEKLLKAENENQVLNKIYRICQGFDTRHLTQVQEELSGLQENNAHIRENLAQLKISNCNIRNIEKPALEKELRRRSDLQKQAVKKLSKYKSLEDRNKDPAKTDPNNERIQIDPNWNLIQIPSYGEVLKQLDESGCEKHARQNNELVAILETRILSLYHKFVSQPPSGTTTELLCCITDSIRKIKSQYHHVQNDEAKMKNSKLEMEVVGRTPEWTGKKNSLLLTLGTKKKKKIKY